MSLDDIINETADLTATIKATLDTPLDEREVQIDELAAEAATTALRLVGDLAAEVKALHQ